MNTFQCPHCGMTMRLPDEPLPPQGLEGSCPGCKQPIRAGGPTEAQAPVSASSPAPDADFAVMGPDGAVKKLSRSEVEERIRADTILAWDQISERGSEFSPACELESFQHLFASRDAVIRAHCWDHGGRPASVYCRQCGRGYCKSCEPRPDRIGVTLLLCPACDGILETPDPRSGEKPFWQRLDEVALYPIQELSWVTTVVLGFFLGLANSGMGIIRPRAFLVIPICLAFLVHAVIRSSKGEKRMGFGPDMSDPLELAGLGVTAIIVTVAVALPGGLLFAFLMWQGIDEPAVIALVMIPVVVFAIAYYPMAFGMSAVWHNRWLAFRPDLVIANAVKIKHDYGILIAYCLAISVIQTISDVSIGQIPILGGIVSGVVFVYLGFVEAHMIGWTLYLNMEKLEQT